MFAAVVIVMRVPFQKVFMLLVSYGAGVQSMVAYLNTRHYVPIGRSAEFLNNIFKIPISTGGICYLLNKAKQKALPFYEAIRQFVLNQTVIGGDETEGNINGKNNWAWAFQKRMVKYEEYVFGFLDYPNLPPDNNGSERAIRNFKIKLKTVGSSSLLKE